MRCAKIYRFVISPYSFDYERHAAVCAQRMAVTVSLSQNSVEDMTHVLSRI